MICGRCENKPLVRGIKVVKCVVCGMETITNAKFADVCLSCSKQYNICQSCGENQSHQIEFYDITKQGE